MAPKCSICLFEMFNNLMVTECGHVFHENCISCWMNISDFCPVCKECTDYTKLYLDIKCNEHIELKEEINSLKNKLKQYEALSMAQSKSIVKKSEQIWQSDIKIKDLQQENAILKDNMKHLNTINHLQLTNKQMCNIKNINIPPIKLTFNNKYVDAMNNMKNINLKIK
eukprot:433636_1